ncbi:MAG: ABC transporter permease [Blautia sp.]|nr:ABC transporter permease [Blautia sp.]
MLFKLIYKNMNFKDGIVYSFSIIFSIILWVIVLSVYQINIQNNLDQKAGGIHALCLFFFAVAFMLSLLFLVYATRFFIRSKNRDYSILLMLGSSRKNIFRFFSGEFFLVAFFSMVIGILLGGIVAAILLLILWKMGYSSELLLSLDIIWIVGSVVKTCFILAVLEYAIAFIYFRKWDLTQMQLRGVKREKKHERTWIIGGLGFYLIIFAVNLTKNKDIASRFLSMAVCLCGVYILMSFGGSLLLKLIKVFKGYYFRHVLSLNEFYYKFSSNCKMLFIMVVLNFLVLYFTGGLFLSDAPDNADSAEYPYGFVGIVDNGRTENVVKEILGEDIVVLPAVTAYKKAGGVAYSNKEYMCISDKGYSELTGKELILDENEAVIINEATADADMADAVYLIQDGGEKEFIVCGIWDEVVFGLEQPLPLYQFVVLPEKSIMDEVNTTMKIIVKEGELDREYEMYNKYITDPNVNIFWRTEFVRNEKETMTFTKIISLFLGIYCQLSCFGILALKIKADKPFIVRKCKTLLFLGMTETDIQKTVVKEYRQLLCLPAAFAIALSFFYMLVELFYSNMLYSKYLAEYFLFQMIILSINMIYYLAVKKMVLAEIIKNAARENKGDLICIS